MIKVMYLPLNFADIKNNGVCTAFANAGCRLEVFDYMSLSVRGMHVDRIREEFIKKVGRFQPQLLHMQIQHTDIINAGIIQQIKNRWKNIKISNITIDVRNYVPKQYKSIGLIADYNCITSTSQIKIFERALGKKVYYWQIGYDPELYYPPNYRNENFEYDAVFIANYTRKENYPGTELREKLCKMLRREFGDRFGLFGGGWPKEFNSKGSLNQTKLVKTYHKSFCSVSVNHYNNLSHYFSDRLLMSMACGRPVISYKFPKWEVYFTNNCDLIMVDKLEEIPSKIKFLLNNRNLANYIGQSGAEKVAAEHTYTSRIKELLHLVGLKK